MTDTHAMRVVSAPLVEPTADTGLIAVFRKRYLLRLLVQRELSARYQASVLGLLWSYIQPATRFLMYYFVIGGILGLHKNVENFGIHIFVGLVLVHYFTETFGAGTRSIVGNRALVQKMAMPREMFPVASMLVSLYHTLPQLLILIVACGLTGWRPDPVGLVSGVLAFVIVMTFGTACALLFSALNVMVRDFQNFVGTLGHLHPLQRADDLHLRHGVHPVRRRPRVDLPAQPDRQCRAPRAALLLERDDQRPGADQCARYAAGPAHPWRGHRAGLVRAAAGRPAHLQPSRAPIPGEPLMAESIVCRNVVKDFRLQYHRTVKQMAVAAAKRKQLSERFLAVNDVSFTVEQGESVGLMGLNGSGKSTLLKLINGVMRPDKGQVLTRGRIAGLIATGAGFHPQLTGRENLFLNAAILGMSEAETKRKFDAIADFADIGRFLDVPVGRYSSGMYARLGFAIAIHVDSDIFLVDEALAVGDKPFKRKCLARMDEVRQEGRTMFYVSHASESVRRMCDRVLVLESGRLVYDGEVDGGIKYLHYDEGEDGEEFSEELEEELGADI